MLDDMTYSKANSLCVNKLIHFHGTVNLLKNFKIKSMVSVTIQNIDDIIMFYFTRCVGYMKLNLKTLTLKPV